MAKKVVDSQHSLRGGHLEPMAYSGTVWAYNYQHPIGMVAVTLYTNNETETELCLETRTPMHMYRRWLTLDTVPSDLSICRYCLSFLRTMN